MASKRAKAPNVPGQSKKPCIPHSLCCLNPSCNKSFKSPGGFRIHLGKFPICEQFYLLHNGKHYTKSMATKPEAPEPVAALQFPWDNEEEEEEFIIPD